MSEAPSVNFNVHSVKRIIVRRFSSGSSKWVRLSFIGKNYEKNYETGVEIYAFGADGEFPLIGIEVDETTPEEPVTVERWVSGRFVATDEGGARYVEGHFEAMNPV